MVLRCGVVKWYASYGYMPLKRIPYYSLAGLASRPQVPHLEIGFARFALKANKMVLALSWLTDPLDDDIIGLEEPHWKCS